MPNSGGCLTVTLGALGKRFLRCAGRLDRQVKIVFGASQFARFAIVFEFDNRAFTSFSKHRSDVFGRPLFSTLPTGEAFRQR